jgi:hypothetical protein
MTYSKPEVKTLDEATAVIRNPRTKAESVLGDGMPPRLHIGIPAYDLDE